MNNELDSPLHECAICLISLGDESNTIDTLECTHTFHKECIDEWVKTSYIESDNGIQWQCPLCRFVMYEEQECVDDTLLSLSVIKFKSKRLYIQLFTVIDIVLSLIALFATDDILFLLWVFCSCYGHSGATHFNIHHIRLYSWFCVFPIVFKISHLITHIDNRNIIIYPPNMACVLLIANIISVYLQLYLMYCIYFLSIHINVYHERLQSHRIRRG